MSDESILFKSWLFPGVGLVYGHFALPIQRCWLVGALVINRPVSMLFTTRSRVSELILEAPSLRNRKV